MIFSIQKKLYLYLFEKLNSNLEKELMYNLTNEQKFKIKYKKHSLYLLLLNPNFFNKYLYQKCLLEEIKTFYNLDQITKDINLINILITKSISLKNIKSEYKNVKLSDYLFTDNNFILNIIELKKQHNLLLNNIPNTQDLDSLDKVNFYSIYDEIFNRLKILIKISLS